MPLNPTNHPVTHACAFCGGTFADHASAKRKYCSPNCYWAAKKKPEKTPDCLCLVCRKPFVKMAGSAGKYCSRACFSNSPKRRDTRACEACKRTFVCMPSSKKRFCSLQCGAPFRPQSMRMIREKRTCEVCKMPFRLNRAVGQGYAGKYCSRFCSDSAVKSFPGDRIQKQCEYCGKSFEVYPSHAHIRCCSNSCGKKNMAKTNVGVAHPLYKAKIPMACEICGTIRMVKPSLVSRYRACSRSCASIIGKTNQPRVSSIERKMEASMSEIGISAIAQFVFGRWICDFAFPDQRLIVECDGDYWHSLPKRKRLDKIKDKQITNKGWRVLRLREWEINQDSHGCAIRIAAMLHVAPSVSPVPKQTRMNLFDN